MYGRLVDGRLERAPYSIIRYITVKGVPKAFRVSNPSGAMYIEAGYLPVIEADCPDDGNNYDMVYTERDGAIYGEWINVDEFEGTNEVDIS